MYLDVDFDELDLVEEVDFLPLVFRDFTPSNQSLMFKLIHELELKKGLKLMDRFKLIYEYNFQEPFVQPVFDSDPIYNVSEDFQEKANISDCFPLSSQVVNISLQRGSKDSCENTLKAPVMEVDRVHFRKGKSPVNIGYDEEDEGAPIMGKREWRQILHQQDADMETSDPTPTIDIDPIQVQGSSKDAFQAVDTANYSQKSPIRVRRNKEKIVPYNLRSRMSSRRSSVDKDTQPTDDDKADKNVTLENMDIEAMDTIHEFNSKFVENYKIAAKRSHSSIILASSTQYIEIKRVVDREAYFNDGRVSIYNHCVNKITALSLLRGYITNRDEVNGLWERPTVVSGQRAIVNGDGRIPPIMGEDG